MSKIPVNGSQGDVRVEARVVGEGRVDQAPLVEATSSRIGRRRFQAHSRRKCKNDSSTPLEILTYDPKPVRKQCLPVVCQLAKCSQAAGRDN